MNPFASRLRPFASPPMHRSLHARLLASFLLVVALVALALYGGYRNLRSTVEAALHDNIEQHIDQVSRELVTTHGLYLERVHAAMRVLQYTTAERGPPAVGAPVRIGDLAIPDLRFGDESVALRFDLVDRVTDLMGGTATLFTRDGDRFVRISTNVKRADGSRAVGTLLDPKGPALAAIRQDQPYYGVVDILGRSYITGYEPIRDAAGQTVGIYYVGYPVETLGLIGEQIADARLLRQGFFALLDSRGRPLFQTTGASLELINAAAPQAEPPDSTWRDRDWSWRSQHFQLWNFTLLAATHRADVQQQSWARVLPVFGFMTPLILVALGLGYFFARRLSNALEEAERLKEEARAARETAEEANRTKSAFLANMSHELRTPMNAIIGYSEMLIEDAEDTGNDEAVPDLKKIHSAGKHLLGLINDVLDLSKIEAGKMTLYLETIAIPAMVSEVAATIQPLVEKNTNRLVVQCPPDLGSMHADVTKVRQTLFNLLSNAAKFTHEGAITLGVARETRDGRDFIAFRVADTGIGMTREQLGKLFQAFVQADASTTRKYGGTGLGLAISRKFCQLMGGDITVASEVGKGTVFTALVPARVTDPAATNHPFAATTAATPAKQEPAATGPLILVVDDDPAVLDLLTRNLTREGYAVRTAQNGRDALAFARQLKPRLITLDVMMPSMDGWSVLTALKADPVTRDIPVVMVSIVDDRQLGFTLGAADYLTKPVDRTRLTEILARHAPHGQERRALVIDDLRDNRAILRTALEREGWTVDEAADGRAGLDTFAAHPPTLILLDLMMPVMDGFEFLRELRSRENGRAVPVVVVTAKELTADERDFLRASVENIVQKGALDHAALIAEIRTRIA